MISRLRIGDEVLIITGSQKGKTGKILKFDEKERVFIENINMRRRHYPSSPTRNAGIETINCSIHTSNLMLILDKKPTKVKVVVKDGKRIRVSRKENI